MKERNKEQETIQSRRRFLKGLAVAGGSAALAATASAAATDVEEKADVAESTSSKQSGYRETDHVRAYYRTAR